MSSQISNTNSLQYLTGIRTLLARDGRPITDQHPETSLTLTCQSYMAEIHINVQAGLQFSML